MATKTQSVKYELIDIPKKTTEFLPTGRSTKAKRYNHIDRKGEYKHLLEICGNCHRPYGNHIGSFCPAYQKIQFIK